MHSNVGFKIHILFTQERPTTRAMAVFGPTQKIPIQLTGLE